MMCTLLHLMAARTMDGRFTICRSDKKPGAKALGFFYELIYCTALCRSCGGAQEFRIATLQNRYHPGLKPLIFLKIFWKENGSVILSVPYA